MPVPRAYNMGVAYQGFHHVYQKLSTYYALSITLIIALAQHCTLEMGSPYHVLTNVGA